MMMPNPASNAAVSAQATAACCDPAFAACVASAGVTKGLIGVVTTCVGVAQGGLCSAGPRVENIVSTCGVVALVELVPLAVVAAVVEQDSVVEVLLVRSLACDDPGWASRPAPARMAGLVGLEEEEEED